MPNYEHDVIINDDYHTYFRPSMIKMEKEIKYEVDDYKNPKIETGSTLFDDYKSLCLVDHPYDRLCWVRKRMNELKIMDDNENKTDIMVLLGVEHKLSAQKTQVDEFIKYYSSLIENISKQLSRCFIKFIRIFHMTRLCEKKVIPLVTNLAKYEVKLKKFIKEQRDIHDMLLFIKGKILYLSDSNINKLGIIKE